MKTDVGTLNALCEGVKESGWSVESCADVLRYKASGTCVLRAADRQLSLIVEALLNECSPQG
jgi:hypothetical protein